MHRQLRNLLREAHGESNFVIAVNIDIRGFSSFFSDSSQAAAYLSRAYTRILDDYFPDTSFFKPTGDGLLLVIAVDEMSLRVTAQQCVANALRLDRDFADICKSFELINFPTPTRVGIGIARGTATRLSAEDKTLDFSGLPLNLASRLMDLARPGGVVFDESFGPGLLESAELARFERSSVFVKGIADNVAITVFATADVVIPDANRTPFGIERFAEEVDRITMGGIAERHIYSYRLSEEPTSRESVKVLVEYPIMDARKNRHRSMSGRLTFDVKEVVEDPHGNLEADFDFDAIHRKLEEIGVKASWRLELTVFYNVPIGTRSRRRAERAKERAAEAIGEAAPASGSQTRPPDPAADDQTDQADAPAAAGRSLTA